MAGTLAAALGCIMAAPRAAATEVTAAQLGGRWSTVSTDPTQPCRDAACRLTYDLAPCGAGWCGVEVRAGNTCGQVAFRLDAGKLALPGVEFFGSYQRTEATRPYVVRASLYARKQQQAQSEELMLAVFGTTDGVFSPFRRSYPMHILLSRLGDAVCRSQPVS